jgi:D-alanine--D-alanine ligase
MIIPPLKVIIIFGGIDGEKNISLSTVRSFMDHSSYNKNIELFFMNEQMWFYKVPVGSIYANNIKDFADTIKNYSHLNWVELLAHLQQPHVIVFNTIHGAMGEDGQLNYFLEHGQIPFTGSTHYTMAKTFDKHQFNQIMKKNGLKTINTFLLPVNDMINLMEIYKQLIKSKKYILKPQKGGSSLGVAIINDGSDLLNKIENHWRQFGSMILEEFFEGMEFSVAVLDTHWSWQPSNKIIFTQTKDVYSYEKKYMINNEVEYLYQQMDPVMEKTIKNHCYNIAKGLQIKSLVRIDGIFKNKEFIINDCNTNPAIDQNSLLFKTKTGPLKSIFDAIIEENINYYYPQLKTYLKAYKKHFLKDDLRQIHMEKIKHFLTKAGINQDQLNIIDKWKGNPMDVAIITGGNSNEKNVALLSGSNVFLQLSQSFLFKPSLFCWHQDNIYPMDYGDCGFTLVDNLVNHLKDPVAIDQWISNLSPDVFVFLGLHGGLGENGHIQSLLKNCYNGSDSQWSRLFMDKYGTALKCHGSRSYGRFLIDTINKKYRYNLEDDWKIYEQNQGWKNYDENLYRLLSENVWCWKPNNDGSSIGIKIIKSFNDIPWDEGGLFIVEEFINGPQWIELTVGVIGKYVLTPSITLSSGEFLTMEEKFQYGLGINLMESSLLNGKQVESIRNQIKSSMASIDFKSYCRVDLFYNVAEDKVTIIEVNGLPALTPATVLYHQGSMEGLSQQQLLEAIIINDYINKN